MQLRPFHETIVAAIRRASDEGLECLAPLIRDTKVPEGHDAIISAWNKRCLELGWGDRQFGVPENLREQQQQTISAETAGKDLGSLNQQVTVAIIEAEKAERKVMALEIAIASMTSPSSVEGRFARRGAVRAALRGVSEERVRALVDRFLAEDGIDNKLSNELRALLP
ncbi:MAG: hypothetical protein HYW56_02660 [Candidatus Harrisonbacteria bacterium]|nr:hypothetical protein [Candidatus Harrisonbacteria bacterium]MBI2604422.1 hypothetical protein [Candidatus Harrisonbacteria bacterium]